MKTLCQTHHLFYSGASCPLCNQERLEGYAHKFVKPVVHTVSATPRIEEKKPREITENDIMKLMAKFNTNTKKH